MTTKPFPRVMLLIDADNVSADVVEQAVAQVQAEQGAVHVRRAYCTAESALANLKLFKAHSIRPIVNLSTGKNSTDIALAVDAVDLVITERPDVVVIVSSDSDFAPLVIKLREKGCRVLGIGQQGKTGDDSKPVYDGFTDIAHRKSRAGVATGAATPARKRTRAGTGRRAEAGLAPASLAATEALPATTAAAAPAAPAAAESPLAAELPAASLSSRRPRRRSQASARPAIDEPSTPRDDSAASAAATAAVTTTTTPAEPVPRAAMPDDLRRILAVLPELARGAPLALGIATERLRSEDLLARNAPSTRLFRKYPDWFVLTPEQQPNKVQYRGALRGG